MRKFKIFLIFFLCVGISLITISFITGYFSERVNNYVSNKATIYASSSIEKAIKDNVLSTMNQETLCKFQKNNDDKIIGIYINTNQVNDVLSKVNESLDETVSKFENVDLKLPIGIIFSEVIFSSSEPSIKIKILLNGGYRTDVISEVIEYGINNSLLKISIKVNISINTIIPLRKENVDIECSIPIVIHLLTGEVPRYYYNTNDKIPFVTDLE